MFLGKALALAKPSAYVSMIQPLDSLLLNQSTTAVNQRTRLLREHRVAEVTNLAALRFVLFEGAVKGPCVFTLQKQSPDEDNLVVYIVPKESKSVEDDFRIVIEPSDIHEFRQSEVQRYPHIWTALAWGSWRDLEFVASLSGHQCLSKLKAEKTIATSEGIIRGNRHKTLTALRGRKIHSETSFPEGTFLSLSARQLPVNDDVKVHSAASTDLSAFNLPQLIIKQSWLAGPGRFRAVIVQSTKHLGGALCSDSYVSVSSLAGDRALLDTICLAFNSKFVTYYQLLTSGQFAAFIPKPLEKELRGVPLPEVKPGALDGLKSFEDVDSRSLDLYGFKPVERILIDDLFTYTLPDFKGDANSPGRLPTPRSKGKDPDLRAYSEQVMRTLRAGFGNDKNLSATIFQEHDHDKLPIRMLGIHLHWPNRESAVELQTIDSSALLSRLRDVYQKLMRANSKCVGFVFERHARLYVDHQIKRGVVPTILIIKPDQRRHWTRTQALRDGDEITREILKMKWGGIGK